MRHILVLLFLIPSITLTSELDLSTPYNTYKSCVQNQGDDISLTFVKEYISHCTTREGKIDNIGNMVFALIMLESFGSAYSEENLDPSELDLLLNKYGGLTRLEKDINTLQTDKLDNLTIDLLSYLNGFESPSGESKQWELSEVIFTENLAKGVLININSIELDKSEVYFKKIGSNWLIDEKPKSD